MDESRKRSSLLKKSFVELIFEENRQIFLLYDGILWQFDSETRYFAFRKTQQFLFSTGWVVFSTHPCTEMLVLRYVIVTKLRHRVIKFTQCAIVWQKNNRGNRCQKSIAVRIYRKKLDTTKPQYHVH